MKGDLDELIVVENVLENTKDEEGVREVQPFSLERGLEGVHHLLSTTKKGPTQAIFNESTH